MMMLVDSFIMYIYKPRKCKIIVICLSCSSPPTIIPDVSDVQVPPPPPSGEITPQLPLKHVELLDIAPPCGALETEEEPYNKLLLYAIMFVYRIGFCDLPCNQVC